jgi:hypothetical protein
MQYRIMVVLALLMGLLSGCLDPGKSAVEKGNQNLGNGINTGNWALVQAQLTDNCVLVYGGKTIPAGAQALVALFKNIKERRGYATDTLHINRLQANEYEADVTSTLKTAKSSHSWEMTQHWVKSGDTFKMDKITFGAANTSLPEVTAAPTTPAPAAASPFNNGAPQGGSPAAGFGIVSDLQAGADYATGATQLKAKKNITEKINNIQSKANQRGGN